MREEAPTLENEFPNHWHIARHVLRSQTASTAQEFWDLLKLPVTSPYYSDESEAKAAWERHISLRVARVGKAAQDSKAYALT